MTEKTAEQVREEIARLIGLKGSIRPISGSQECHVEAIESQIAVLERRLTVAEAHSTYSTYGSDGQYIAVCAVEAAEWRDGTLVVDEPPSVAWKGMVRPAPTPAQASRLDCAGPGPLSDRAVSKILRDIGAVDRGAPAIRLARALAGSPYVLH